MADTLTAFVDYTMPADTEINKLFGVVMWGESKEFRPIKACKNISHEPREIEFVLVHLDQEVGIRTVYRELDRQGLRPALLVELLAFSAKHYGQPWRFPIAALGSVIRSGGITGMVIHLYGRRGLFVTWFGAGFNKDVRFLTVRK